MGTEEDDKIMALVIAGAEPLAAQNDPADGLKVDRNFHDAGDFADALRLIRACPLQNLDDLLLDGVDEALRLWHLATACCRRE
jgi:hypothetical protein